MKSKDHDSNESIAWDIKKMVDDTYVPPTGSESNNLDLDGRTRKTSKEELANAKSHTKYL